VSGHSQRVDPLLKIVIFVLLVGVVVSLFSGLVFLFKDSDRQDSKRTLYALGIRVTLAAALLLTVFYGLYTGQLRMGANAPWHAETRNSAPVENPESSTSDATP
jgi:Zn-dependent protease with chaperone function